MPRVIRWKFSIVSASALLVLMLMTLLTWLSLLGMNPNAEIFDRIDIKLGEFAVTQSRLQQDLLMTHASLSADHISLAGSVEALDAELGELREVAAIDTEVTLAVNLLAGSVDQEKEMIEQFNVNSNLLRNSFKQFRLLSAHLADTNRDTFLASSIAALTSAMLDLTLDTSPVTTAEVRSRLVALGALSAPSGSAEEVQALLAHGWVLHRLFPATDDLLRSLLALPIGLEHQCVRTLVLRHRQASRSRAHEFRLLIYAVSLLLLGILSYLGLRLQSRTRELQRHAALEHVLAGFSTRLINSGPDEIGMLVEQVLAQLAHCIGADRAYFVTASNPVRIHSWSRDEIVAARGWPNEAMALAASLNRGTDGAICVADVEKLPSGSEKDALAAVGLRGWVCVSNTTEESFASILGFDALRPFSTTPATELGLLRMAFDAIASACDRGLLERERKRLETNLQQARRLETIGVFASGIAHNFNNIVGAILGYSEMAQAHVETGGPAASNLNEIRRAGECARDLVDQILAFGRRRTLGCSRVDVGDVIAESRSLLSASLSTQIELVTRETPEAAVIAGDPSQLQQVILNLCNNASAAMGGAGRIEIEADIRDPANAMPLTHGTVVPGRYAVISVSDTGHGMDRATIEQIFEPFFTTRLDGNGLGLATTREIVDEHGGAIDVKSTPGVGTRFEIWLPADRSADLAEEKRRFRGQGETVLVIDGEREQLLRHEELLAALGYEPVGFTDADQAIAACRAIPTRFDAALLCHLQPSSALDLALKLRQAAPELPILLATASMWDFDINVFQGAGGLDIVRQPFLFWELAGSMARCLATTRLKPEARS